jgi:hypothetical protein
LIVDLQSLYPHPFRAVASRFTVSPLAGWTKRCVRQLNPIIRGWANYHRHGASKATFAKVDSAIFKALWQWATRRHPNKGARWIKHKYFGSIGGRNWRFLWKAQDGLCPVCNQKITELTGWHNHHIVWRSLGGSDRTENRVLLHPNCHRQIHSHGLSVVKPRPEKGV